MCSQGVTLLAEEPGFLVLDKGPGLDFHDHDGCPGLCSLVRDWMGAPVFPVHRLDKPTSGIVLLARTRGWAAILAGLFRERAVGKYYLALSDQAPRKKQGLVVGDMVRSRRGSWKLTRTMERPARTRFVSRPIAPSMRLFVLKPLTGRTHQLRVAMKSLGAPILGDSLYHSWTPDWPDRMYLHAHTLRFVLDRHVFVYRCPPRAGTWFQDTRVGQVMTDLGPLEELAWPARGADKALG